MYSAYSLHRNPDPVRCPETFDPERWEKARAGKGPPRGALPPSGAGSHRCTGDVLPLTGTAQRAAAGWPPRPVPGVCPEPEPRTALEPGPLATRCGTR
ncbi:cytochrome P450 [Streptomyces diacarni]|uniref:Cytochrome P450 n=1 Tax=Streptomyces diacarni TaxID=2800381 RepID=A0A367EFR3_9ACTN|nr:cytochrome P450 [Streptomyces diacarni]